MARSIISLRSKAPPRAISALMRSARSVFSLSISAPQVLTVLSLSSAAAASTRHGGGSINKSLAGAAPAADAPCESATHRTDAKTALVILKQPRIDCLARSFRYRRDRSKRSAVRTAADLQLIASSPRLIGSRELFDGLRATQKPVAMGPGSALAIARLSGTTRDES